MDPLLDLLKRIKKLVILPTQTEREKIAETSWKVHSILDGQKSNSEKLKKYGQKCGFGDNNSRQRAWRRLIFREEKFSFQKFVKSDEFKGRNDKLSKEKMANESVKIEDTFYQIELDVKRSFTVGDNHVYEDKETLQNAKKSLESVLKKLFVRDNRISYTQGLHELVSIFFYVCGEKTAYDMSIVVIEKFYRDFLQEDMKKVNNLLKFPLEIIKLADKRVYEKITKCGIDGFYQLSWMLTWFSHEKDNMNQILRTFDFIFSTDFIMPYYIAAAKVLSAKNDFKKVDSNENDVVYFLYKLSKKNETEEILKLSKWLYVRYRPGYVLSSLGKNTSLNSESALYQNIQRSVQLRAKKNIINKISSKTVKIASEFSKWFHNPKTVHKNYASAVVICIMVLFMLVHLMRFLSD